MSTRTEEFNANVAGIPGSGSVKKIAESGTHVIGLHELNVNVDLTAAGGDVNLTFPHAAKAKGCFASVYVLLPVTTPGSYDVAPTFPGVPAYAPGDMDVATDTIIVYSDGMRWLPVLADMAH